MRGGVHLDRSSHKVRGQTEFLGEALFLPDEEIRLRVSSYAGGGFFLFSFFFFNFIFYFLKFISKLVSI